MCLEILFKDVNKKNTKLLFSMGFGLHSACAFSLIEHMILFFFFFWAQPQLPKKCFFLMAFFTLFSNHAGIPSGFGFFFNIFINNMHFICI